MWLVFDSTNEAKSLFVLSRLVLKKQRGFKRDNERYTLLRPRCLFEKETLQHKRYRPPCSFI
jgi:hypothetical protein